MRKTTAGVPAFAAVGAALVGALSSAGPAAAKRACQVVPKSALVPHLLTPCAGATVRRGVKSFTFTVYDVNAKSRTYPPYINLRTSPRRRHGHLPDDTSGNGIYAEMSPVKGHRGRWTYTAKDMKFPSYWLNRSGTDYVQVQQIDDRAGGSLQFYSPILAIHVR